MTFVGWWQIAIVLALVLITAIPLATYRERLRRQGQFPVACLATGRARLLWLAGVDEKREQSVVHLCDCHDRLSIAGFVSLYALQRFQNVCAQSAGF